MLSRAADDAKQADLTQGSIVKPLVLFALPLLGSSLIQQMYNTVDIIFIGHLLGKEAAAAVKAVVSMVFAATVAGGLALTLVGYALSSIFRGGFKLIKGSRAGKKATELLRMVELPEYYCS
ncbi:MAG: hypothetical protein ACRDBM_07520, partial [Sporomusa sp.]